jgi:hypothetical protein
LQLLFDELGDEDKINFNFNHKEINYENYFESTLFEIRRLLLKEDTTTIPKAQSKLNKLFHLDLALKTILAITILLGILIHIG